MTLQGTIFFIILANTLIQNFHLTKQVWLANQGHTVLDSSVVMQITPPPKFALGQNVPRGHSILGQTLPL